MPLLAMVRWNWDIFNKFIVHEIVAVALCSCTFFVSASMTFLQRETNLICYSV